MSVNKFTPGPWVCGAGNCHTVYGPKKYGHQQIIAVCPTQHGERDYDSRIVLANARLIAAAPDLYAALEQIERLSREADRSQVDVASMLSDISRAALAKARGEWGNSYAIPTLDDHFQKRDLHDIALDVIDFLIHAIDSDDDFFVTRIGCGIAGFADAQIAPLFKGAPDNCNFPEEWKPYV